MLHVLRVFVGDGGAAGTLWGSSWTGGGAGRRAPGGRGGPRLLRDGVREDPGQGRLRIFTPKEEFPFAGHPLVGTAGSWRAKALRFRRASARRRGSRQGRGRHHFISGRPEWAPPFEHVELGSSAEVEALVGPPTATISRGVGLEDEEAGYVRARCFRAVGYRGGRGDGAHAVR